MNNNKTYWTDDPELVEKYVLGQLTDEERQRLDAEIADCESCKRKLRHELEMAAGIRRYGRDSLKAKLHSTLRKKQSSQMQQFQFVGLAAAVVIIAIGIGVYKIWFGDLTAPKKFSSREIILKQQEQPKEASKKEESQAAGETDKKEERTAAGESTSPSSKDIAEAKPSRSDKESRVNPVSGELKKSAAPSDLAMHDKVSTIKESAGAVSTAEANKTAVRVARTYKEQSIWLIGEVVMVSNASPQPVSKIAQQKLQSEQFIAKEEGSKKKSTRQIGRQSRTIMMKRGEEEGQVVLQQRSFGELPAKRQTQLGKENHVETLLEQSKTGSLSLTIFSDVLTADELESATVETSSDDSLVISTLSQRIYYRLPAALSSSQRSRR